MVPSPRALMLLKAPVVWTVGSFFLKKIPFFFAFLLVLNSNLWFYFHLSSGIYLKINIKNPTNQTTIPSPLFLCDKIIIKLYKTSFVIREITKILSYNIEHFLSLHSPELLLEIHSSLSHHGQYLWAATLCPLQNPTAFSKLWVDTRDATYFLPANGTSLQTPKE